MADKFKRQSVRLKNYDYSNPGYYFITICTQKGEFLFGDIKNNRMISSPIGQIAENCWNEIPRHFENVILDYHIIMPNHFHGIIIIQEEDITHCNSRGLINQTPTNNPWILMLNSNLTLGKIIRHFKAKTAKMAHSNGHINFAWQRNYYEHVIRNEKELRKIRQYILNNPANWHLDTENPSSNKSHPVSFNIDMDSSD